MRTRIGLRLIVFLTAVLHMAGPATAEIALQPVNKPAADTTARDAQLKSTVVDLGGGKLVAAFSDAGSIDDSHAQYTGYAYSSDNGATWTDGGRLPGSSRGDGGEPVLVYHAPSKSVYLVTRAFYGGSIQVFKSTDDGHTFAAPVEPFSLRQGSEAPPWIAVDSFPGAGSGHVYVCMPGYFTDTSTTFGVLFARSTDGGATFKPGNSNTYGIAAYTDRCVVAVGPTHEVYLFYHRAPPYASAFVMRKSTDFGASFGPEIVVAQLSANGLVPLEDGIPSAQQPRVAINPVASRPFIYLVYNDTDGTDPSLGSEVFYVRSVNGGKTWSRPVKVNDVTAGDQFRPTVAISKAGDQILVGYDSRVPDPYFAFHRQSRLGTLSATGNVTFNPSFRLGPDTPSTFLQDYHQGQGGGSPYDDPFDADDKSAGGADAISTTWSDNRFGDAFHAFQSDIFFARIAVPPPAADLGLAVAASPTAVARGQDVVYTVTARSTGGKSNDVFIQVPVSEGFTIRSAQTSTGRCWVVNGAAGCSLGAIAAGATATATITATATRTGTFALSVQGTSSSVDTRRANNVAASPAVTVSGNGVLAAIYSTGRLAVPLAAGQTVDVPLNVPDAGSIVDIVARVRVHHPFDRFLALSLVSPTNQVTVLSANHGDYLADYGSGNQDCTGALTSFNDHAIGTIRAGTPPYVGGFKPDVPMFNLVGAPSQGVWKLRVTDDRYNGVVRCVQLAIVRRP